MKTLWTVNFCNCGGFIYCDKCELPCEHDRICPRCNGYDFYPAKCRDMIDVLVAKDGDELYRTRAAAYESIVEASVA